MKIEHREHLARVNKQIKEMIGVYRDAVKHLDISESEFWVWYTLVAMDGDHTQQDICAMWSLPKQTVNTAIAHMRLRRYATLEAMPRTRNRKIIRLTAEGRRFGEKWLRYPGFLGNILTLSGRKCCAKGRLQFCETDRFL